MRKLMSRRTALRTTAALACGAVFSPAIVRAAPTTIRFANGGAIAPNEIETLMTVEFFQKNVLKRYGKDYELQATFTRGTPEAAALMAAGRADLACLSFPIFAASVLKDAVPGGMSIIADVFQDGHQGYASNSFFVLEDSPIKTVRDLKGKKVAVNAFSSAVDLELRVVLKKNGLDPKKDVEIVEVGFPNMGPALREKRVDCVVMVLPFMAVETSKGGLRTLFTGADAFPTFSVVFMAARNEFIKEHRDAVKAWVEDYVGMLKWLYTPENRAKAVEVTAAFTKSPATILNTYFLTPSDYYRDPSGCIGPRNVQPAIDAMTKEGFLPAAVDMGKYIDTSFLPHPCKA
jgi:ABC-type nitrate/sulfonate/bicarbonate transport system substrate-binding protein